MRYYITLTLALVLSMLFATLNSAQSLWAVPLTGNTGPGGFEATDAASALQLWLRGDVGVVGSPVTQWTDQSFFGNDAVPDAAGNQPAVSTLNGRAAVGFTGTGDTTTNDRLEFPTVSAQTILVTNRVATGASFLAGIVGAFGDFGIRRISATEWRNPGDGGDFTNPAGSQFHVNGSSTSTVNENVNHMLTAIRDTGTANINSLGDYFSSQSRPFDGDIGEVVIYNRELNVAERTVLENNQSAKYGITISNDRYTGDTAHGFDQDVFGIGHDASDSLALENAGAAGFGLQATAGASASELNEGEYFLAGHDEATNNVIPIGGTSLVEGDRWQRNWFVDSNLSTADVTVGFSFDDAGGGSYSASDSYSLLFADPNDPTGWTIVSQNALIETGDVITFALTGSQLVNGFYTLGINATPPVPEPSSFLLLGLGMLGMVRHTRRRGSKA